MFKNSKKSGISGGPRHRGEKQRGTKAIPCRVSSITRPISPYLVDFGKIELYVQPERDR